MTIIGITGPSGAGKGTLSKIMQDKFGFKVIDADGIYHSLVSAHSPCLEEIKKQFGVSVIDKNGALDRTALGKIVFGNENNDKLLLLNKITHKHVIEEILRDIESYRLENANCIIDAPLLLEAGLDRYCNFTIAVLADEKTRAERIIERDNISHKKAMARISSQKRDEFYESRTDYTVINNGDVSLLGSAIETILSEKGVIR